MVHACSCMQVVLMYLKKGHQELQMQLCHRWPHVVEQVIRGERRGHAMPSTE